MRPARRAISRRRQRAVPDQSRLTVRRAVAALRRSREALTDVQGQLDALLLALRDSAPDGTSALRGDGDLSDSTQKAARALSALGSLRRFLPPRP